MGSNKILSHICPSCANRLTIDKEKAIFHCDSCGNSYDYNYFWGGNLLEKAGETLELKEYSTAAYMYELVLQEDPSKFEAVVGLFNAEYRIPGAKNYTLNEILKARPTKDLNKFKDMVSDDKKEFFSKFEATPFHVTRIKENTSTITKLTELNKQHDRRTYRIDEEIPTHTVPIRLKYSTSEMSPTAAIVSSVIGEVLVLGLSIGLFADTSNYSEGPNALPLVVGLFFAIVIAIPGVIGIIQRNNVIALQKEKNELKNKITTNIHTINTLEEEIIESKKAIGKLMHEAKSFVFKETEDNDN